MLPNLRSYDSVVSATAHPSPTWPTTYRALRVTGGVPAYLLTDNPRTVTVEHVAGIPVRHPDMVALGRHYGAVVAKYRPFHPESKRLVRLSQRGLTTGPSPGLAGSGVRPPLRADLAGLDPQAVRCQHAADFAHLRAPGKYRQTSLRR
jgi:hypothetical protein